ncbi:MAG: hypothetical protein RLZZ543_856, partial [Bacteroidota bacterium]
MHCPILLPLLPVSKTPYTPQQKQERAVLVGLVTRNQSEDLLDEYLDELAFLTETAGAIPIKRFTQKMDRPDSKTFLGSGKLQQIVEYIEANEIDLLI